MNKRKTREYTSEFRRSAVQLALRSPSIKVAAKELGVPGPTLSTWIYRFKEGALTAPSDTIHPEEESLDPVTVKQLKENLVKLLEDNRQLNKVAVLEEERLILKKAALSSNDHCNILLIATAIKEDVEWVRRRILEVFHLNNRLRFGLGGGKVNRSAI